MVTKMGAKKTMIVAVVAAVIIAAVVLIALNYPRFESKRPDVKLAGVSVSDSVNGGSGSHSQVSSSVEYLVINTDNVQNVISTMSRTESYHRTLSVVSYWDGGETTYQIESWVSPEASRMSIQKSGGDVKNMLVSGDMCYVWYGDGEKLYSFTMGDMVGDSVHVADEFQMLATYEDILKLEKSDIADAGYAVLDGVRYIYAETEENELGYTEKYYISIDTGLLEAAETMDGETAVYRMLALSTEKTEIPAEIFVLPGQ